MGILSLRSLDGDKLWIGSSSTPDHGSDEQPTTVTVTFDGNGNGMTTTQEVVFIDGAPGHIGQFPTYSMTGHRLDGWYDQPEGGNRISESTPIDHDMTVYAHWTLLSYRVTYHNMSNIETETVNWGQPLGEHAHAERPGYDFAGWFTGQQGAGEQMTPETLVYSDLTLYSHYTPIEYAISYVMNGHGTVPADAWTSYNIESQQYSPAIPSEQGYTFLGWDPQSIPHGSTGEFTFTANWAQDGQEQQEEPESHLNDPEIQEEFANIDEEFPIDSDFSLNGFSDEPGDEEGEEEEEVPPVEHEDDPEDVDIEDFGHVDENSNVGQDRQTEEDMRRSLFNIIQLMQRG